MRKSFWHYRASVCISEKEHKTVRVIGKSRYLSTSGVIKKAVEFYINQSRVNEEK